MLSIGLNICLAYSVTGIAGVYSKAAGNCISEPQRPNRTLSNPQSNPVKLERTGKLI